MLKTYLLSLTASFSPLIIIFYHVYVLKFQNDRFLHREDFLFLLLFPLLSLEIPFPCQDCVHLCSPFILLWFTVLTLNPVIHLEFVLVSVVRQGALHVYYFPNWLPAPAPFTEPPSHPLLQCSHRPPHGALTSCLDLLLDFLLFLSFALTWAPAELL